MPSEQLNLTNIEKQASDPLQVLATQKKVSFDESNLSSHNSNHDNMTSHNVCEVKLLHDHDHISVKGIRNSSMMNEQIEHLEEQRSDDEGGNDNDDHDEEGTLTDSPPQAIIEEDNLVVSDAKCYSNPSNQNSSTSSNRSNESDEDSQSSNTTTPSGVLNPNDEDILSGRGAGVNLHPGNVFFRKLISANKGIYLKADPGEKKRIIRRIVEKAQSHGRFLKQDPTTELWTKITSEEARKKTGQALRENGASVKKQHKAQMMKKYEAQFSNLPTYDALQQQNTTSTTNSKSASVSPYTSPSNPSTNPMKRNRDIPLSTLSQSSAPTPSSSAAAAAQFSTNLLWARMNTLQEKQEQLKRKQRELEDEQHQLMQCFYQLTALSAVGGVPTPSSTTSSTSLLTPSTSMDLQGMIPTMNPSRCNSSGMDLIAQMQRFYPTNHQHQAMMDTASDCDSDQMYNKVLKKRRIVVPNH